MSSETMGLPQTPIAMVRHKGSLHSLSCSPKILLSFSLPVPIQLLLNMNAKTGNVSIEFVNGGKYY